MKVNFSDMSNMIAQEVMKAMVPRIRKIVREEVGRGVRRVVREQKLMQENMEQSNSYNFDPSALHEDVDNSGLAREELAKRAHDKSRKILEKKFTSDDPFAELIMNVEDPMEARNMQEQTIRALPMVKSNEVAKGDIVLPEQMDFNDRIDKLI